MVYSEAMCRKARKSDYGFEGTKLKYYVAHATGLVCQLCENPNNM